MTDEDRADLPRTSPALRKALVRMQLEAGRQQLGEEVELLWQPLRHLEDRGRHLGRRLQALGPPLWLALAAPLDRKSTRLNSRHVAISYAVFCLKNKNKSDMNAETVRRLSTVECSRAARTLCVHSIMIEENTTTCLSRDHW